jgi:hypothetical protein
MGEKRFLTVGPDGQRVAADGAASPHLALQVDGRVNLTMGRADLNLSLALSLGSDGRWQPGAALRLTRPLYVEPADPFTGITWAAPVIINAAWVAANATLENGRYWIRGHSWRSLITNTNACDVQTAQPLGFEQCNMMGVYGQGTGVGIFGSTTGHLVDLVVQDCSFYGPKTNLTTGQAAGRPVFGYWKRLIWRNNNFFNCGGLGANDWRGDNAGEPSFYYGYNRFTNIDSRTRDTSTATGYKRGHQEGVDYHFVQMVQLGRVQGISGAVIEHNRATFEQDNGFVEDNVNLNASSGVPGSPISVRFNLIDGAGSNEYAQQYAGGGIALGDGGGRYQEATDNTVLETANYAVATAGGRDQLIARNTIIGMGYKDDGVSALDADSDAGLFARDYNETIGPDKPRDPASIRIIQNTIGWWIDNPGLRGRNDLYVSDFVAGQAVASPPVLVATLGTGSEVNTTLDLPAFPTDPTQRGAATAAWLSAKNAARSAWLSAHTTDATLVGRRIPR